MKFGSFIDSDFYGSGPFTSRIFYKCEIFPLEDISDSEIECRDEDGNSVDFKSLHPTDQKTIRDSLAKWTEFLSDVHDFIGQEMRARKWE